WALSNEKSTLSRVPPGPFLYAPSTRIAATACATISLTVESQPPLPKPSSSAGGKKSPHSDAARTATAFSDRTKSAKHVRPIRIVVPSLDRSTKVSRRALSVWQWSQSWPLALYQGDKSSLQPAGCETI